MGLASGVTDGGQASELLPLASYIEKLGSF